MLLNGDLKSTYVRQSTWFYFVFFFCCAISGHFVVIDLFSAMSLMFWAQISASFFSWKLPKHLYAIYTVLLWSMSANLELGEKMKMFLPTISVSFTFFIYMATTTFNRRASKRFQIVKSANQQTVFGNMTLRRVCVFTMRTVQCDEHTHIRFILNYRIVQWQYIYICEHNTISGIIKFIGIYKL